MEPGGSSTEFLNGPNRRGRGGLFRTPQETVRDPASHTLRVYGLLYGGRIEELREIGGNPRPEDGVHIVEYKAA